MEVLFHLWSGGLGQRLWRIGSLRKNPLLPNIWIRLDITRTGENGRTLCTTWRKERDRGSGRRGGGKTMLEIRGDVVKIWTVSGFSIRIGITDLYSQVNEEVEWK